MSENIKLLHFGIPTPQYLNSFCAYIIQKQQFAEKILIPDLMETSHIYSTVVGESYLMKQYFSPSPLYVRTSISDFIATPRLFVCNTSDAGSPGPRLSSKMCYYTDSPKFKNFPQFCQQAI